VTAPDDPVVLPEHAKLAAVQETSQALGEFMDWFHGRGWVLAYHPDERSDLLVPVRRAIPDVLAEYLDVDRDRLEDEKRLILARLRADHTPTDDRPPTEEPRP
jgi:hypothetical protein